MDGDWSSLQIRPSRSRERQNLAPFGPLTVFSVRLGMGGRKDNGFAICAEAGARDAVLGVQGMDEVAIVG